MYVKEISYVGTKVKQNIITIIIIIIIIIRIYVKAQSCSWKSKSNRKRIERPEESCLNKGTLFHAQCTSHQTRSLRYLSNVFRRVAFPPFQPSFSIVISLTLDWPHLVHTLVSPWPFPMGHRVVPYGFMFPASERNATERRVIRKLLYHYHYTTYTRHYRRLENRINRHLITFTKRELSRLCESTIRGVTTFQRFPYSKAYSRPDTISETVLLLSSLNIISGIIIYCYYFGLRGRG